MFLWSLLYWIFFIHLGRFVTAAAAAADEDDGGYLVVLFIFVVKYNKNIKEVMRCDDITILHKTKDIIYGKKL